MNVEQLKAAAAAARAANPNMRARDLAAEAGMSEAQLVALGNGTTAIPLRPMFKALLQEVHTLGTVMALTRNQDAVHERQGVYSNVSFEGPVGLVLNPDIDMRLFMAHWSFGFAVTEGDRRSLQFFDRSGEAVHKIYLRDDTKVGAFDALADKYRDADPQMLLPVEAYSAPPPGLADEAIDAAAFREAWLTMTDSHQFVPMLRSFGVSRHQAMRLAPGGFVRELAPEATVSLLQAAVAGAVPVMIFVANRGCIQIHTGPVSRLLATGPWFNVLDPQFSLHLRQVAVSSVYLVRKPSTDGDVHSVEAYDAGGALILQVFGSRKPGTPELEAWRVLTAALPLFQVAAG